MRRVWSSFAELLECDWPNGPSLTLALLLVGTQDILVYSDEDRPEVPAEWQVTVLFSLDVRVQYRVVKTNCPK